MRRAIALIVSVLILCALLCACGQSKGDTTSTEDGALVPITRDSGDILGYERYYHDSNGNLTRVDSYDSKEVYDHYLIMEYDSENRLIKESRYKADGLGDFYYTYTYDDDGNMTEKGYYTMHDGATRTLYDEKGVEIERYTYDADDKLIKHEVKTDGNWILATEPETEPTTEAE